MTHIILLISLLCGTFALLGYLLGHAVGFAKGWEAGWVVRDQHEKRKK